MEKHSLPYHFLLLLKYHLDRIFEDLLQLNISNYIPLLHEITLAVDHHHAKLGI